MLQEHAGDCVGKNASVKTFKKVQKKAGKRGKTKYNKIYIELWQCKCCDYEWAYKTQRCPLCSTMSPVKIV